jgi:hypothetical protein
MPVTVALRHRLSGAVIIQLQVERPAGGPGTVTVTGTRAAAAGFLLVSSLSTSHGSTLAIQHMCDQNNMSRYFK